MPALIAVTPQQVAQWAGWYADGQSMRDIAKRVGRSANYVRDRFAAAAVPIDRKRHIAIKAIGRPSARKGVKLSAEQCAAMGDRARGNKYCVGRKVSDETRQRMRDAMLERNRRWLEEGCPYPSSQRRDMPRAVAKQRQSRPPTPRPRAWVDPETARLTEHQRQKFKRVLKSLLRATKCRKRAKTADALGYTRDQLVAHIQRQFRPGMSWSDRASFSIDHVVPVVEFIRRGITDPKVACSLANLQPLTPYENRKKSDKYHGDFDDDLRRIIEFNAAHFENGRVRYTAGL